MHSLSKSNKTRIIRDIIAGARLYEKFLVPYDFLIVTNDGKYNEVSEYYGVARPLYTVK
jgi:hypothetical protein